MTRYFRVLTIPLIGIFGALLGVEARASTAQAISATCRYYLTAPFSSASLNYGELKQIVEEESKLPYVNFLRAVEAGGNVWGGELSAAFWAHYTGDDKFAAELRASTRFPISREVRWTDLDNLDRYLERHRGEHIGSLRAPLTFDLRASWLGRSFVSEGASAEELKVFAGVNTILRHGDHVRGVGMTLDIASLLSHGDNFDVYSLNGKNGNRELWIPQDLQRMSLLASEQYRAMMQIPAEARVAIEPVYGYRGQIMALLVEKLDATPRADEFLYRVRRNHLREHELKQYYDLKEFVSKYAAEKLKKELNLTELPLNKLADLTGQSSIFSRIAYVRNSGRWVFVK